MEKTIELKKIPTLFGLKPINIKYGKKDFNSYLIRKIEDYVNKHLPDGVKESFDGKYIFKLPGSFGTVRKTVYDKDANRLRFVGFVYKGEKGVWVVER